MCHIHGTDSLAIFDVIQTFSLEIKHGGASSGSQVSNINHIWLSLLGAGCILYVRWERLAMFGQSKRTKDTK